MSSNEGWQCVQRAAVATAMVLLLAARPGNADDRSEEPETAASAEVIQSSEPLQATLTLGEALAFALRRSPNLTSFSWEIRAKEARAFQAGLLPNPIFAAEVENIAGSGEMDGGKSAETTLRLSQLIELGGKRAKRRSLGELGVKVAEWEYEAARLEVVAETTAAFVEALARQHAVRLANDQIRVAEDVLSNVEAQVRAGAVPTAEVPRAELEVTKQKIERRLQGRALRAAYVRLATAWGVSEPTFESLAGDLGAVSPIPSEAELVARLSSTPELARWQAEVTRRRAAIELEDARRTPDVTLGLGPRHFNDSNDWALVVGLEMPIPVFDRNQGSRRASRSEFDRTRAQRRSAELRLRRALATSYRDVASAFEEVEALRDEAIPTAERAYAAMKSAQSRGALGFTDVLDAQRSLFALRTQLVVAMASYHLSRAQTEALVGGPLAPEKE